jgi:hypothetical protein
VCAEVGDSKIVNKIFGKFKDAFAQCLRARQPDGIIGKEFRIAMLNHVGAGTGWHHNITGCFFEHADHMLCHRSGFGAHARVEGWLSATGLVGGKIHVNAEAVENVHDGFTSLRVERIDEAGDEKLNVSHASIVILNPYQTPEVCLKEFKV